AGIFCVTRLLKAPRDLNEPACCRYSSLKTMRMPASPKSAPSTRMTGVRRTCGAMRAAASRIETSSRPATTGARVRGSVADNVAGLGFAQVEDGLERAEVGGLHEVIVEAGFVGSTPVLALPPAGHRDQRGGAELGIF